MSRSITARLPVLTLVLLLTLGAQSLVAQGSEIANAALATVSGTIRHDGMPVAGVRVTLVWQSGVRELTTGADGRYSVSGVATGGWMNIHIRPPGDMLLWWRPCMIEAAPQHAVDLSQVIVLQPVGQPESLGQ